MANISFSQAVFSDNKSYTFQWLDVAQATKYQVSVKDSAGNTVYTTTSSSSDISCKLTDGAYSFTVTALDSKGNVLAQDTSKSYALNSATPLDYDIASIYNSSIIGSLGGSVINGKKSQYYVTALAGEPLAGRHFYTQADTSIVSLAATAKMMVISDSENIYVYRENNKSQWSYVQSFSVSGKIVLEESGDYLAVGGSVYFIDGNKLTEVGKNYYSGDALYFGGDWLLTTNGIYEFRNGKVTDYTALFGKDAKFSEADCNGDLLVSFSNNGSNVNNQFNNKTKKPTIITYTEYNGTWMQDSTLTLPEMETLIGDGWTLKLDESLELNGNQLKVVVRAAKITADGEESGGTAFLYVFERSGSGWKKKIFKEFTNGYTADFIWSGSGVSLVDDNGKVTTVVADKDAALPDLSFTKLNNKWSDALVVSTTTKTNTSSNIFTDQDKIFLDFNINNSGTASAEATTVSIYIDGKLYKTEDIAAISKGGNRTFSDFNIGNLSAGTHTIKIVVNENNTILEDSSTNNTIEQVIDVIELPADSAIGNNFVGAIGYGGNYKDSYSFTLSHAGLYDLTGSIGAVNGKITIYDANGKKVANATVKGGVISFKDKLLNAGKYSIVLESNKKTQGAYNFGISGEEFVSADNSNDIYQNADTLQINNSAAGWVGFGDVNDYYELDLNHSGSYSFNVSNVANPVKITIYQQQSNGKLKVLKNITVKSGSGGIKDLLLDKSVGKVYVSVSATGAKKGQNTDYYLGFTGEEFNKGDNSDDIFAKAQKLGFNEKVTGWVGYGDAVDYFMVDLASSGSLDFNISDVSSSTKITVYQLQSNGKLKSLKSITVKSGSGSIKDLLCDLGKGKIYVAIEGTTAKKGGYTDYNFNVSGDLFTKGDNTDDMFAKAQTIGLNTPVTDWAGFGDAVDYFMVDLANSGSLDFTISDVSSSVKLTVYQLQSNGKLKSLKSITIKSGSGSIKDLLCDISKGKIYVGVESTTAKKGGSTDYKLDVTGDIFTQGNNSDDTCKGATRLGVNSSESNWAGFGDAVDYFELDCSASGSYDIGVSGINSAVKLTIYQLQSNGKLKQVKSTTIKSGSGGFDDLVLNPSGGKLYASLEVINAKKGLCTGYELTFTGDAVSEAMTALALNDSVAALGESTWQNDLAAERKNGLLA